MYGGVATRQTLLCWNSDVAARHCRMLSVSGDMAARCRSLNVCGGSGGVLSMGDGQRAW